MTDLRKAAEMALDALENMNPYPASKENQRNKAITALRQVLEQPQTPDDLLRQSEREACAKLCESMRPSKQEYDQRFYTACTLCANAIRARGENNE